MTITLPDNRKPQPPAGVLRGPADASAFRVKVGRYGDRWYADALPACDIAPATDAAWPSVSTVKKAKPFEGANYTAMKRIVAERQTIDFTAPDDKLYDTFKTIDRRSLTAAGDRGTHVHKMAEQMLYGLPVDQKGPGAAYYPALAQFFDAYQPELVCAEFVCIHRDLNGYGYGGTADGGLMIDGQLAIVDWKSRGEDAEHGAYPEEGAQLAAYARAQYIVAEGDGMAKRIAVPAFTAGLIVSIKPDGCVVYPVDLDKAAVHYEQLHAWWVARLDEKKHIGKPWPIRTMTVAVDPGRGPAADGGVEAVVAAAASPADPFDGLATQDETPSLATKPYAVPVPTAVPVWTATPAPEGDEVDAKTVWRLTEGYKRRDAAKQAVMREILKDAQRAGVPFGQVEKNPTMRRFELGRALLAVADHATHEGEIDDALVRGALVLVMGDRPEVAHAPIGALIGCLDPDEARSFVRVLEGVSDGTYVADFSTNSLLLKQRVA